MTKKELLKQLKREIKNLEYAINHPVLMKLNHSVMQRVLSLGLALDKCLPYILAIFIMFYAGNNEKNFLQSKKTIKSTVNTIDFSNGYHFEKEGFDYTFSDELLKYSTGWKVNNRGLYERMVTTYRLNSSIDLNDLESIFKISQEEINDLFVIINQELIQKNYLDDEDFVYNEDVLIVTNNYENENNTMEVNKNIYENTIDLFFIAMLIFISGLAGSKIKKIVFKDKIRNDLLKLKNNYQVINYNEWQIKELKAILQLKKENLSLLQEENDHSYRLGRRG